MDERVYPHLLEPLALYDNQNPYRLPPQIVNAAGQPRTVGFELEFTGLTLEETIAAFLRALPGKVSMSTAAESLIEIEGLGSFKVEVDWSYLKKLAQEHQEFRPELSLLSDTASLIVPIEVVCPPLMITELHRLDPLVVLLRDAGARGTDNSLFAAYGVHVNTEIPALTASVLDVYLKAFCLLQWWLVKTHRVNLTRRVTPYVDLYPDRYLRRVIASREPSLEQIIDDYLTFNPTRNRALDMLPLFSEIDSRKVRHAVNDPRIKSRPTFHYRLPNCLIDTPGWSLREAWNIWCIVEELAHRPQDITRLCDEFLMHWRPAFGVDESQWVKRIGSWLKESGLE